MIQSLKTSAPKKAALFVAGAMLLWGAAAVFVLRCAALDVLLFLLYQAAFVAAPGIALFKLLGLALTPLESLVLSYALGLGLNIAVYFLFAPFGLAQLIPYALAVLAALAVVVLIKTRNRRFSRAADTGELRIALVICCVAAVLTFFMLSSVSLNPGLSGARFYYHDTLNGVGLLSSAARGFPFEFLQMSDTPYYYHPFFYAYGACMKLTLGIPAFELATQYMLITIAPLLAGAFVALARRLIGCNRVFGAISLLFFALPLQGFLHYLYIDTLGFALGLGFLLIALNLFLQAQQQEKPINRYHVLAAVFVLLALGAKGPLAVTLLFGLCFVLLVEFIKKPNWNSILKGLLLAVPFFVVYFLLYRDGAGDSLIFRPGFLALQTPFAAWLSGIGVSGFLLTLLSCLAYLPLRLPALFAVFVFSLLYLFSKKPKPKNPAAVFFAGALAFGFIAANLFSQAGSSQLYFATCMLPAAYILAGFLFERLVDWAESQKIKAALRAAGIVGAVGLAVLGGVQNAALYSAAARETVEFSWLNPAAHITTDQQLAELEASGLRGAYMTSAEYEAMVWVRDNTEPDAVFACGRVFDTNKYFYYSAFSERAFYMEGWGYVTMEDTNQYTAERQRREQYLRVLYLEQDADMAVLLSSQEGVDYFIIDEYLNPGFALPGDVAELVYSNADVRIYRALGAGD